MAKKTTRASQDVVEARMDAVLDQPHPVAILVEQPTEPPPLPAEQPVAPPDEQTAVVHQAEAPKPPEAHPNGNGHAPRRPDMSWALNTDRTTRLEIAAWVNVYKNQQTGEEYEQVTFTLTRSYRDQQNQWVKGGPFRNHDMPIVIFLASKAHAWALERRMTTS